MDSAIMFEDPIYYTMPSAIPVICFDDTNGIGIITIIGDNNLSFSWSNGQNTDTAFNLAAGVYYVTTTDTLNCSVTDTIQIQNRPEFRDRDSVPGR